MPPWGDYTMGGLHNGGIAQSGGATPGIITRGRGIRLMGGVSVPQVRKPSHEIQTHEFDWDYGNPVPVMLDWSGRQP